jgi:ABC-2 type transport system ATP-binding protein
VPTKVVWFCGGHGLCLNNLLDPADGPLIKQQTVEWLNRYVKGDPSVSTGPQFEWVDQRGQWFSSDVYPVRHGSPIVTSSGAGGVLPLIPYLGGSGVPLIPFGFKAINAVNLTVPAATATTYVVGAPELTLTYSGTGSSSHVYAQLVDDTTGLVLGNIVTPVPVTLDGQTHTVSLALEPVAQTLRPGQTVTLQLVASAGLYESVVPSLGVLTVSNMQLMLPTSDAAAISSPFVVQLTVAA